MATEQELESIIVRLTGDGSEFQRMLQQAQAATMLVTTQIQQSSDQIEGFAKSITTFAGVAASALGALGASNFLKSAFNMFVQQESIIVKLSAAIQANGQAVEPTLAAHKAFAQEMRESIGVGTDRTLQLLQMAESYGITGKAARDAVQAAESLEKTGRGSAEMFIMVNRAVEEGNVQMLHRIPALRGIKGDSEKLAAAQKMLGSAFEVAKASMNSTEGIMTRLQMNVKDLTKQFGSIVAEGVRPVAIWLTNLVRLFNNLDDETKRIIVVSLAFAAGLLSIGPAVATITRFVIPFINVVMSGFTLIGSTILLLLNPLNIIIGIFTAVGSIIAMVFSPLGVLIGGAVVFILLMVDKLGGLKQAWITTRDNILKVWEVVKAKTLETWDIIQRKVKDFLDWIKPVTDTIRTIFELMWEAVKEYALPTWEAIKDAVGVVRDRIVSLSEIATGWVVDFIKDNKDAVEVTIALAGAIGLLYGAFRVMMITMGVVNALLSYFKIQQLALIIVGAAWNAITWLSNIAITALSIQFTLWNALLTTGTIFTTGWTTVLGTSTIGTWLWNAAISAGIAINSAWNANLLFGTSLHSAWTAAVAFGETLLVGWTAATAAATFARGVDNVALATSEFLLGVWEAATGAAIFVQGLWTAGILGSTISMHIATAATAVWAVIIGVWEASVAAATVVWGFLNTELTLATVLNGLWSAGATISTLATNLWNSAGLAMTAILTGTGTGFMAMIGLSGPFSLSLIASKVATWLLNAALTVADALLGGIPLVIGVVVVGLVALAAAFLGASAGALALSGAISLVIVGIALVNSVIGMIVIAAGGVWEALLGILDAIKMIPTASGPIKAISDVFSEWYAILSDVVRISQVSMPYAWLLLKATAQLALLQVKALFPPVWDYIQRGFGALWEVAMITLEMQFDETLAALKVKLLSVPSEIGAAFNSALEIMKMQAQHFAGIISSDYLKRGIDAIKGAGAEKAEGEVASLRNRLKTAQENLAKQLARFDLPADSEELKQARALVDMLRNGIPMAERAAAEAKEKDAQGTEEQRKQYEKLGKEVGKFDAVLYSSAEAQARISKYKQHLEDSGAEVGKAAAPKSSTLADVEKWAAGLGKSGPIAPPTIGGIPPVAPPTMPRIPPVPPIAPPVIPAPLAPGMPGMPPVPPIAPPVIPPPIAPGMPPLPGGLGAPISLTASLSDASIAGMKVQLEAIRKVELEVSINPANIDILMPTLAALKPLVLMPVLDPVATALLKDKIAAAGNITLVFDTDLRGVQRKVDTILRHIDLDVDINPANIDILHTRLVRFLAPLELDLSVDTTMIDLALEPYKVLEVMVMPDLTELLAAFAIPREIKVIPTIAKLEEGKPAGPDIPGAPKPIPPTRIDVDVGRDKVVELLTVAVKHLETIATKPGFVFAEAGIA